MSASRPGSDKRSRHKYLIPVILSNAFALQDNEQSLTRLVVRHRCHNTTWIQSDQATRFNDTTHTSRQQGQLLCTFDTMCEAVPSKTEQMCSCFTSQGCIRFYLARNALNATSNDDPADHARLLDTLGNYLGMRYSIFGAMGDLEEAILLGSEAVRMMPPTNPNHILCLNNLATSLGDRYRRHGDMASLDESIQIAQDIVDATPSTQPLWATYLNNLAAQLLRRHSITDATDDLDRAIDYLRKASNATNLAERGDDIQAMALNNLVVALGSRYQRFGEISDLGEAISIAQKVVNETPIDNPERPKRLKNLSNCVTKRYARTQSMADLDEAIRAAEEAAAAIPDHHLDRASYLNNLGILLGDRHLKTGTMESLDRAIEIGKEALDKTSLSHPSRAARLNNLAIRIRDRYSKTKSTEYINKTISLMRKIVGATDTRNPDPARWLNNFSVPHGNRYPNTREMADLEESIKVSQEAVSITPHDDLYRASYLNNLGDRLGERSNVFNNRAQADLKAAILHYRDALRQSNSAALDRVLAGRNVLPYHVAAMDWQKAFEDSAIAINLVPRLTPRSLENSDKLHLLGQIVDLACDAAAVAMQAGQTPFVALNLLEQGRGILATSLNQRRTDIVDLQSHHPDLANEFVRLRNELDYPVSRNMYSEDKYTMSAVPTDANRCPTLGLDFDNHVLKIRERPGFEDFLLPPNEREVKAAANCGPIVVINVSKIRCDALIVERGKGIRVLALTNLTIVELEDIAQNGDQESRRSLVWMWDVIAKPVLDELGLVNPTSDNYKPQVWWIPTGKLSTFPLHAAGRSDKSFPDTMYARTLSFFSSSIVAMIQIHRCREAEVSTNRQFLQDIAITSELLLPLNSSNKPPWSIRRHSVSVEETSGRDAAMVVPELESDFLSKNQEQYTEVEPSFDNSGSEKHLCLPKQLDAVTAIMKEKHVMEDRSEVSSDQWQDIQGALPDSCRWDIGYKAEDPPSAMKNGCWTCVPLQACQIPLTIADAPVVIPVEYQWPPSGGLDPPSDPRRSNPIDCRMEVTTTIARGILLAFPGSVGFYVLINGLLQIIVSNEFNTAWASEHLPHKFGGLKYSGRIGLKVSKDDEPRLLMSTHVITEAILGKSFFGLDIGRDPVKRLRDDWDPQVEISANDDKIGSIEKTFDHTAAIYPNGFAHGITMVKPFSAAAVQDIKSPIDDLGWLSREAWSFLRQRQTSIKILGAAEMDRNVKCIKCNLSSEVSIIGEGIVYNQSAAAGSKSPKDQDISIWSKLVSRAVLYRVSPDFDPPQGYSGIALLTDGKREDSTQGPGVIGLQSFVQRSGHPQSFSMPEGPAMEQRLRTGRIAFYGAFQIPDELRKDYIIS
ncbi:hypothetical protein OPT61_g9005 [Boeremia exigua]|uniref:Uncharacterized protein n=1 Tax=Boeremia exigua TaxID=749465 RepID=A0ACC2HWT5_9PLEO|nr:hypothetical protein OPT61_g9005 [Boeremia exigua]